MLNPPEAVFIAPIVGIRDQLMSQEVGMHFTGNLCRIPFIAAFAGKFPACAKCRFDGAWQAWFLMAGSEKHCEEKESREGKTADLQGGTLRKAGLKEGMPGAVRHFASFGAIKISKPKPWTALLMLFILIFLHLCLKAQKTD
jgi:hypothetical protein